MVLRQEKPKKPTLRHDCRIGTGRGMTLQVPPMSDMQGTVMTYVHHHTHSECVWVCAPPHSLYLYPSPSPLFQVLFFCLIICQSFCSLWKRPMSSPSLFKQRSSACGTAWSLEDAIGSYLVLVSAVDRLLLCVVSAVHCTHISPSLGHHMRLYLFLLCGRYIALFPHLLVLLYFVCPIRRHC